MMYQDHEKRIYAPKGAPDGMSYDPLALDRTLVRATNGNLGGLVRDWQAVTDDLGDVSPGSKERNALTSAEAEEQLVRAARVAFGLPAFPECLDATALEWLTDFLEYMAGKGTRAASTHSSHTTAPAV